MKEEIMKERRMEDIPEELKAELEKYLKDPKRYRKLHPVIYKMLQKYLETENK